jgi:hypothetical protein
MGNGVEIEELLPSRHSFCPHHDLALLFFVGIVFFVVQKKRNQA